MKSTIYGKIAFDKNLKRFNGMGDCAESLENIGKMIYPITYSDELIIEEYDENYRKNIEIWTVEITVKVI